MNLPHLYLQPSLYLLHKHTRLGAFCKVKLCPPVPGQRDVLCSFSFFSSGLSLLPLSCSLSQHCQPYLMTDLPHVCLLSLFAVNVWRWSSLGPTATVCTLNCDCSRPRCFLPLRDAGCYRQSTLVSDVILYFAKASEGTAVVGKTCLTVSNNTETLWNLRHICLFNLFSVWTVRFFFNPITFIVSIFLYSTLPRCTWTHSWNISTVYFHFLRVPFRTLWACFLITAASMIRRWRLLVVEFAAIWLVISCFL